MKQYVNFYEVAGHYTPYGVEEQENYNKVVTAKEDSEREDV